MKKYFILGFLLLVFSTVILYSQNEEEKLINDLKNNVPSYLNELERILNKYNNGQATYSDILEGMRLSASLYLAVNNKKTKLKVVSLGYKFSKIAIDMDPGRGEGYYYAGMFIGFTGFLKGIPYILNFFPQIEKWAKKAVELNPEYNKGAPYVLLCAIYYHAPGFPVSIGSVDKAKKYCFKAMRNYPENCTSYLYLATIEDMYGNIPEAKKILKKGIRVCRPVPYTVESKIWYYRDVEMAKKMLNYLNNGKKIKELLKER